MAVSIGYALHPFRLSVALGGMESSLFVALILFTYVSILVHGRPELGSVAAALAFLTRPESILALGPLFIWRTVEKPRWAHPLIWPGMMLLLPWLIFTLIYFGSPVPNSVTAKAITYSYPPGFGAFFFLTFLGTGTLGPYLQPVLILGAACIALILLAAGNFYLLRWKPIVLVITQFPIVYGLAVVLTNAPADFPWYYHPLIPGLLIALIAAPGAVLPRRSIIRAAAMCALVGFAILIAAILSHLHPSWPISREREAAYLEACPVLSSIVDDADSLLAPDIGVIGWCLSDVKIIDPIGLVSPEALEYSPSLPPGQHLSVDFLEYSEPDYIVALEQYLANVILDDHAVDEPFKIIWSRPVSITGRTQQLYVLEHSKD